MEVCQIIGYPQKPKTSDFGLPLYPKMLIVSSLILTLLAFHLPAIQLPGTVNSLGFGWDHPLLWGVAVSGLFVVTMLSFAGIHLIFNATKLDRMKDYVYVRALNGNGESQSS